MGAGDYTLSNIGVYSLQSSDLTTAVAGVTITSDQFISGGRLHFIPVEEGQVQLLLVEVATA